MTELQRPPAQSRLLVYLGECTTWSLMPYPRCEFRCVYCITRAQGVSAPLYAADAVVPQLRRELAEIPMGASITVGSLSDAYPPAEERYGVTRLAVAELIAQRRPFAIVTKGRTVCRDIDLLSDYREHCAVQISLCTLDRSALRRLDPRAPSPAERLKVVRALARAGLCVSISVAPWIPGVSSARQLLDRAPPGVLVQFAPLNVAKPWVPKSILGRHYCQEEVDALYLHEREITGVHPQAVWLYPVGHPAGDGAHHPFNAMPPMPPGHLAGT